MNVTRIKGVQGVYSCHGPRQRPVEGIAVYYYDRVEMWSCEAHGTWRPWLPEQGVPCEHISAVLAQQGKA